MSEESITPYINRVGLDVLPSDPNIKLYRTWHSAVVFWNSAPIRDRTRSTRLRSWRPIDWAAKTNSMAHWREVLKNYSVKWKKKCIWPGTVVFWSKSFTFHFIFTVHFSNFLIRNFFVTIYWWEAYKVSGTHKLKKFEEVQH